MISPVCLPDDYVETDLVSVLTSPGDQDPVVVGWGATHSYGPAETRLRQATVPVVSREDCREAYQDIDVNIGDNKICAGRGTTDTCNGDSGGPLLADNRGHRLDSISSPN